jgi:uncharacterized protein (DUF1800 family)
VSIGPGLQASIAVTRFGLGAKPGEIDQARADPAGFLKAQIRAEGADQPQGQLESSNQAVAGFAAFQMARRDAKAAGDRNTDVVKEARMMLRDTAGADFLARAQLGCATDAAFRERWTLFWCNHFTVAANKIFTAALVGPFEREAIRPHVFGRFEDLLVASTSHPGMLYYLDQAQSTGPDSPLAERRAKGGLNENLAREIMELHTLGVGSGYTQADVTEFARALTGWSFIGPNEARRAGPFALRGEPGDFVFRTYAHEPGVRRILDKAYAQEGQEQARAILHDLAAHPATAHHVAVKLARHFVADDPPPSLVARLEQRYAESGGRLDQLAAALIDAPEAWTPAGLKFKTPYEFIVSGYRALGVEPSAVEKIAPVLASLGQKPFSAPSPKGWPEEAETWAAPDAIIKRMGWSEAFSGVVAPVSGEPVEIARNTLGARLSPAVATAMIRAESRPEALSILLMSPEFQRR